MVILCFCGEGKEMSEIIELLYPIYLDIPMMISFVATMDGGYSLEKVWKQTNDTSGESNHSGTFLHFYLKPNESVPE